MELGRKHVSHRLAGGGWDMRITETRGETSGRHRGGVDLTAERGRFSEGGGDVGTRVTSTVFLVGREAEVGLCEVQKNVVTPARAKTGGNALFRKADCI